MTKQRAGTLCRLLILAMILIIPAQAFGVVSSNGQKAEPYVIPGLVTVVFEDDIDLNNFSAKAGKAKFGLATLDPVLDKFDVTSARKLFPWEKERQVNSGLPD